MEGEPFSITWVEKKIEPKIKTRRSQARPSSRNWATLSVRSQGHQDPEHKGHSGRWVHKSAAVTGAQEPEKSPDSLKQHVADKSASLVFSCLVPFNTHKAKRRPWLRESHEGIIKILAIYIMIS